MIQAIILGVGAVAAAAACITVLASFLTGGLDDVDTRQPKRRFPK